MVRAITLHFWLAYDHPFCEFISISSVINQARAKHERSFLQSTASRNFAHSGQLRALMDLRLSPCPTCHERHQDPEPARGSPRA